MYYKNGPRKKRKPKRTDSFHQRGTPIVYASVKNTEIKEMSVLENVVDFMKNMNPQQLVDFLLPKDDDWHVKTSSGNASGN